MNVEKVWKHKRQEKYDNETKTNMCITGRTCGFDSLTDLIEGEINQDDCMCIWCQ